MEFLRFGSSIPGAYWGCCACCIIQNFNVAPDAPASIQLVDGDGGMPLTKGKGHAFVGPTYRDIFHQRLRFGTFGMRAMPNHAFFAILTRNQIQSTHGKAWLAILKEAGFEFIRTVSNSVYAGAGTTNPGTFGDNSPNHIFGLIRNVGTGAISDPYTPPKEWTDMESVVPEAWEALAKQSKKLTLASQEAQLKCFEALPPQKLYSEEELVKAGVPITLAGKRSEFPQELKDVREARVKAKEDKTKADVKAVKVPSPSVFPTPE